MNIKQLKAWAVLAEMGWNVRRILDSLEGRTHGLTESDLDAARISLCQVGDLSEDVYHLGPEELEKLNQAFTLYLEYLGGDETLYVGLVDSFHEIRAILSQYNGSI